MNVKAVETVCVCVCDMVTKTCVRDMVYMHVCERYGICDICVFASQVLETATGDDDRVRIASDCTMTLVPAIGISPQ